MYSSFFVWLRDRDRVRRNPMVLVESIKVEKRNDGNVMGTADYVRKENL